MYPQADFLLRRWKEMAQAHPGLARKQPWKAVIEGDQERLAGMLAHVPGLIRGMTEAYGGITVEAFERAVRAFFDTARHPVFGVPDTRLAYQPMRELIDLLTASEFEVYICSAPSQSESASYRDPPQQTTTAEQAHLQPSLLSPFRSSIQRHSYYSRGNDMERGQEGKESQDSRVRSSKPDTQYRGAYRHVSSPIIEPKAQTENYEPLQYHHQAFENSTRPVDKRAFSKLTLASWTSDGSANYDSQTRHGHLTS